MNKNEMAIDAQTDPHCQLCGADEKSVALVPAAIVRATVAAKIRESYPQWNDTGFICRRHLNQFRTRYVESLLTAEKGELSEIEKEVVLALAQHEIVAEHLEDEFLQSLSFGERMSDKIATFGGSWKFIITFFTILIVWIIINSIVLLARPFDPYPFILLNLILSCLAAIQAPIIMMSQNRQEAKDRLRSEQDYRVNLKSELEIRHLHEKMDHLLNHQWARLVEIQQLQLEIMNEYRGESD